MIANIGKARQLTSNVHMERYVQKHVHKATHQAEADAKEKHEQNKKNNKTSTKVNYTNSIKLKVLKKASRLFEVAFKHNRL